MSDFDVIVIGSGPGGYVAAIRCAQLGLKTACVDKNPNFGGTCLNVGCIPSKALLHSSELFAQLTHELPQHGISLSNPQFDFAKMMGRKNSIVTSFNQGIAALFKKNKITSYVGTGQITSPTTVSVIGDQKADLTTKSIILATGSEPMTLPFLSIDEEQIVTSTGALSLKKVPQNLIVVGAGIIGVELGSVYNRLGSKVTFIEFLDKICPTLDVEISKAFQKILEKQGLTFHLSSKVTNARKEKGQVILTVNDKTEYSADVVLVSIGRRPYTQNLGLEKVGITPTDRGFIPINGRFQTRIPNIYAIGDIVDGPMLAHKASEEGIAVAELIAGHQPTIDYLAIPNVVYTTPEVASVGLTEEEANKMNIKYKAGSFPFKVNSRAKCTGEEEGMVKILADEKTDRIIGVHILGAHASELIAEGVLAIQKRITALDLANTSHAHPTLSEAIKEAALAVHKRAIHR